MRVGRGAHESCIGWRRGGHSNARLRRPAVAVDVAGHEAARLRPGEREMRCPDGVRESEAETQRACAARMRHYREWRVAAALRDLDLAS